MKLTSKQRTVLLKSCVFKIPMEEIAKQIFISATQNVMDYFALNDGKFGDALLGNSRLKLLLQLEETEAVKLQEKLMLTERETMQIIRSTRGQGLLCAGKNRIAVEIRASKTEFDLITTDRESLEKRFTGNKKEPENRL